MKICIYSGTFNPVHMAHVNVIEGILKEFDYDKIIIIPNNIPPHKDSTTIVSAQHRLNMLHLVFENPKVEISDIEIQRGGASYSYETVIQIKKLYEYKDKIDFLIGTDAILGIKSWYKYQELLKEVNFVVVQRQNEINIEKAIKDLQLSNLSYKISKVPFLNISSTQIRKILRKNGMPQDIIPEKVLNYIKNNNLYKNDFDKILEILETEYNGHLEHSVAVAEMASRLAQTYEIDENQAYLAGILHDCVKYIGIDKIKNLITEYSIDVFDHEMQAPKTLHAPVGAFVAKQKFNIEDQKVLDAIRFHTIGRCDMTLLEKIIFISDKIEPVTREEEFRAKIEPELQKSLDHAILKYFELLIEKLKSENVQITQYTLQVLEYFQSIV